MCFSIILQKDTERIYLTSDDFIKQGDRYAYNNGKTIVSACITRNNNGNEVVSNIGVEIAGDYTLHTVKYPIVQLSNGATFDNLLMSSAWGDNIERPAKTIRDLWSSPTVDLGQNYLVYAENEVIYTYPSIMAMQYMVLYNPSNSIYVATYDTGDDTKTYHAKATTKFDLELSVGHYPFVKNGKWVSPDCGYAKLNGGWHSAARLYASHMASAYPAPDSPGWLRERYHGWIEFIMKYENKPATFKFADLPAMYREVAESTGMNHLFIAGWMDDGHDTKYPRYIIHEPSGTPEELKSAANAVKEMGGRLSFYTNSRLVDNRGEYYNENGYKAVCANEDGTDYTESYGTRSIYAVACPGCDEYIDQMSKVTKRLIEEYGVHGMFTDQISCNYAPFCYNGEHGHSKPSDNFLPGVEKLLRGIRRTHQVLDEDFHTFSEGCHERFSQYYDVNQGHGEDYTWQIGKSMPEQFSYTFPDRIVTGLCMDKQQMYHSMAQFKPLDVKPACYADKSNHKSLKDYIALRTNYKKYFLQGKFIDDEGFTYAQGIRLFASLALDGSACICLWRPGAVEDDLCESFVKLPEAYKSYEPILPKSTMITCDGKWLHVKWEGALCYIVFNI